MKEIGRGGFATVYRARDEALQIERAVKILHPALVADPTFIERFREEARLVARLKNPHITPVYDLGEDQGRIYLAMEYMPGGSLKDLLENDGPLPFQRALEVLKQIANALDYAHGLDLVHRDVKPGNILFDEKGNAYLTDFGFAKSMASADSSTTMSLTGGVLGTPAYMSPEAWDGEGWTPAADVYSLACVFFEMLMGRPLFDGESPTRLMKQHVIEGPRLPEQWPVGVPEGINFIFKKGLAEEPGTRFASMESFVNVLGTIRDREREDKRHQPFSQRSEDRKRFWKRGRDSIYTQISNVRNRTFLTVAGILGIILLLSMTIFVIYITVYMPERQAARDTQIVQIDVQNTQAAFDRNLTAEAQSWTVTSVATRLKMPATPTASWTPVINPTDTPAAGLALDDRDAQLTATMGSLFTQQASNLLTVTPISTQLPSTGFADDVGIPGLLALLGAMILVIFLVDRLRKSS